MRLFCKLLNLKHELSISDQKMSLRIQSEQKNMKKFSTKFRFGSQSQKKQTKCFKFNIWQIFIRPQWWLMTVKEKRPEHQWTSCFCDVVALYSTSAAQFSHHCCSSSQTGFLCVCWFVVQTPTWIRTLVWLWSAVFVHSRSCWTKKKIKR